MLYDNSQLARVYLHARQVTGNEFFRTIAEEILDYVVREMLDPQGDFYSTQDADSEVEEGKFFVWTPDEIRAGLGDEADACMAAYGVTRHGNASTGSAHGFEGKNILEFVGEMDQRPAEAADFTNELRYVDTAHRALAQMKPMMGQYPLGFGQGLQALAYSLSKPEEIAIVCDPGSTDAQALLSVVRTGYRPFQAVALGAPSSEGAEAPLLRCCPTLPG